MKFLTRVGIVYNGRNNRCLLFVAHIAEIAKQNFRPIQSVEELLAAHSINDAILDCTNPSTETDLKKKDRF